MEIRHHKNARTTLKVRREIKESKLSINQIAKKYGITWGTAKKWKDAEQLGDKTSRPNKLRTDLTSKQEDYIIFHRKQFKSTIDEIYLVFEKKFKEINIYPMKIYRCLRRHGLNVIPKEFKEEERKIKKFRKYGIGYIHIDLMYSKQMNGKKYYIYTCIDRVSRLAYVHLTNTRKADESVKFLRKVVRYYPYKINYVLTDNGTEFVYVGKVKKQKNKKLHKFERECKKQKIQHRKTKIEHPWTNGMVERFNRKIREKVINIKYFNSIEELAIDLERYINKYNFDIKLKALNYKTPIDFINIRMKKSLTKKQIISLNQSHITYRY